MGLSTAISDALERWKRRRQESRERKSEAEEWRRHDERAQARTPTEVANLIAAGDFESRSAARRVPMAIRSKLAGANTSRLAADIAELSDADRYLLALAADGWTTEEIASRSFKGLKTIRMNLRRIYLELGEKQSE